HTLPCISWRPYALGKNDPTSTVRRRYSLGSPVPYIDLPSKLAWCAVMVLPVENCVVVPARDEYSHSASVIKRKSLPVFRDSQDVYSFASDQDTFITGDRPRPHPASLGLYLHPPSATHASHSENVTSNFPTAKG